jgi:hypothetical protein
MEDIFILLQRWGSWVRIGSIVSGYVSPSAALMRDNTGGVVAAAQITDDQALAVDKAIAILNSKKKEQGHAVAVYFICDCDTHAELGRRLKCSKGTAQKRLDSGVAWMDGYFTEQDKAA